MSERRQNEPELIDLTSLLYDARAVIRKFWWLVIGLALVFALKEYFTVSVNYQPQYIASATMTVRCEGSNLDYINEETAAQMAEVFPYILRSGILQKEVAEEMGLESMPGSISMSSEVGTNFFTISANAGEPEKSYELLQATLAVYPEVAEVVVGEFEMEILDETGIPEDTGKEEVIRGSYKRGAIQGLCLGIGIMFIYVLTRNTVKKRKELKNVVNLEDFGSIPLVPEKKRKKKSKSNVVDLRKARVPYFYLEAMRKLRIRISKEMEANGYKSLLVTSSIPGEGKTTLAVNLALSYVRQGKKVILVDCDSRNPSVATCMGVKKPYPGIGAVLRKEVPLSRAIAEVEVDGEILRVIFGGKPEVNATQLYGGEMMKKLINALEKYADIVIFDTAPSELLADATVLARNVDAALYVVKCDYAKKSQIRSGVQALSESDIKILGCVFNMDISRRNTGYGYGYKNYGGYYGNYGRRKQEDLSGRVIKD